MIKSKNFIFSTSRWWNSLDKQIIFALFCLISISILLISAVSHAASNRIGIHNSYFIIRQFYYLLISILIMISLSMCNKDIIKKLSIICLFLGIAMLIAVKLYGNEFKGAKRWLNIFGISIQPSEFVKPFFLTVSGWILSLRSSNFPSFKISFVLLSIIITLFLLQPDVGASIILTTCWSIQIFIAEISFIYILFIGFTGISGIYLAYLFLPHVHKRIDSFFSQEESYQVAKSLTAFKRGGIYGTGPGEGIVKYSLPDSHTDFIFAVAGEEFGLIGCLVIISVFAFIIIKSIIKIKNMHDKYLIYASTGIISNFGLQSIINISASLNLIPTKGVTLPLISYGGSSIISIAVSMGFLLSFTKYNFTEHKYKLVNKIKI